MKYFFKFLVFIEAFAIVTIGIIHLLSVFYYERSFPIIIYPIMMLIVFVALIFVYFVVIPLEEWWFDE